MKRAPAAEPLNAERPDRPPPRRDPDPASGHWVGGAQARVNHLLRTISERDGEIRMLGEEVRRLRLALATAEGALMSVDRVMREDVAGAMKRVREAIEH